MRWLALSATYTLSLSSAAKTGVSICPAAVPFVPHLSKKAGEPPRVAAMETDARGTPAADAGGTAIGTSRAAARAATAAGRARKTAGLRRIRLMISSLATDRARSINPGSWLEA